MFISHVLYKVENLQQAVEKLTDEGFIVHTPGNLKNAYHAIVWFEKGPYLELIVPEKSMNLPHWIMNLTGYGLFVKRHKKWCESPQGWCDLGIESDKTDLTREKEILKKHGVPYKQVHPKVRNGAGQVVSWYNVVTDDYYFPFLVSGYNINSRPSGIVHPNGATEVDKVFMGKENFNQTLFKDLMTCENWYEMVEGEGVQGVSIKGTNIKFEESLI